MKAVLISIQPKWCELIASGKKAVEVRKTKPKLETPFKVYIYQTLHREHNGRTYSDGKVIGEFVCDSLIWVVAHPSIFAGHPLFYRQAINDACLTRDEVEKYSGGKDVYGWHISDLVIYDKPKHIVEFCHPCDRDPQCDCNYCIRYSGNKPILHAPQSWCYVEEVGR